MLRYFLPTLLVLVLLSMSGHMATAGASDGSADVRTMRASPSSAPMIAPLCPVDEALDRRRAACQICPDDAADDRGTLTARRIYRGDLAGDDKTRALVVLQGCGSGDESDSTALVEQHDDGWRLVEYRPGLNASSCRTADLGEDGTALICRDRTMESGVTETNVFALRVGAEGFRNIELAEMYDRSARCDETENVVVRRLDSIHTGELVDDQPVAVGLAVESLHRPEGAGCEDNDLERRLTLEVFRPTDGGFEPVEIDDPCGHPGRIQALESASSGRCSQ